MKANGTARQAAVEQWQAAARTGVLLSGAELARQWDRSPSWGRQVAREARSLPPPAGPPAGDSEAPVADRVGDSTAFLDELLPPGAPAGPPGADSGAPVGDSEAPAAPTGADSAPLPVPGWVRRATTAAITVVALAAAVASVDHLAAVARAAGTTGEKVWLLPAAVDGLAVAGALTLYVAHLSRQAAGVLPWLALLGGLAASVVGNVIAVHPELVPLSWLRIGVGATPPLALAVSVELALRQIRT